MSFQSLTALSEKINKIFWGALALPSWKKKTVLRCLRGVQGLGMFYSTSNTHKLVLAGPDAITERERVVFQEKVLVNLTAHVSSMEKDAYG